MPHYKFDQIAYNITDKKMPEPGDEKMYIGLEHLDSGSLKVTRWGSEVELKGQKLVMKKGDVLFGRRNTYLRRAAIAPHDGIFSAHGMIFRPKTEVIDSEYFPFFISSNYFMDAAIRISVGSLSPTVNWKTLKELEFNIPSLDEQRKNARMLAAINETKEAYQELLLQTDNLVKSQFIEVFGDPVENPHGWLTKGLMELGSCKNGMNFGAKDIGVTIKSVGVGDIKDYDNIEDIESLTTISLNEMPSEEYMLKDGDLVFVRSNGNKELVGRCVAVYPHETPVSFSGFCIRFRKESSDVLLEYLLRYLKMPEVRAKMAGRGANIQNLNQKILAALQVPVPPLETQMAYVAFVRQSDKSKFELKEAIKSCDALMKAILFTNLEEKED